MRNRFALIVVLAKHLHNRTKGVIHECMHNFHDLHYWYVFTFTMLEQCVFVFLNYLLSPRGSDYNVRLEEKLCVVPYASKKKRRPLQLSTLSGWCKNHNSIFTDTEKFRLHSLYTTEAQLLNTHTHT